MEQSDIKASLSLEALLSRTLLSVDLTKNHSIHGAFQKPTTVDSGEKSRVVSIASANLPENREDGSDPMNLLSGPQEEGWTEHTAWTRGVTLRRVLYLLTLHRLNLA